MGAKRQCKICDHPDVLEINKALTTGLSQDDVRNRWGNIFSVRTVQNHIQHMEVTPKEVAIQVLEKTAVQPLKADLATSLMPGRASKLLQYTIENTVMCVEGLKEIALTYGSIKAFETMAPHLRLLLEIDKYANQLEQLGELDKEMVITIDVLEPEE